jgi:hypothetical protein
MRILFFISACSFLFLSCEKEAKVKLPDTKSVPVLYSYICPDDTVIRLKLLASQPLYSSNQIDIQADVPDANVKISSAQGTAWLVFNPATGYYELQTQIYPIVAGQVYKLTVTTINGGMATAETQVPFASIPISRVSVQTVKENYQTSDRIQVFFTDEPGTENYYRMVGLHQFINRFQTDTTAYDMHMSELLSDISHDGEEVSLTGTFYEVYDSSRYTVQYYDIFLYNCSPSYYNFYKSLYNHSEVNPFAEPTLIHSNVKGGLGCFAAYTRSRFRYKKK